MIEYILDNWLTIYLWGLIPALMYFGFCKGTNMSANETIKWPDIVGLVFVLVLWPIIFPFFLMGMGMRIGRKCR